MTLSAYQYMWVLAMFDLPTVKPEEKKAYASFRQELLNDGFSMMQYSIYIRHCGNLENADVHVKRIAAALPKKGELRVMVFTDKQFGRMQLFGGGYHDGLPEPGQQLEMF